MIIKNGPMNLGDIFSNGFSYAAKTFKKNMAIAAMFIIPPGILIIFAMQALFEANFIVKLKAQAGNIVIPGIPMETDTTTVMIFVLIAGVVFGLSYLASQIGILKTIVAELQGESISLNEAIKFIFSSAYLKVIGLFLFIGFALGGLIALPAIVIEIGNYLDIEVIVIISYALFLAAFCVVAYMSVLWVFCFIHILSTSDGIIESLKYSVSMVKGYWWRTFGIFLLTSLAAEFIVSVITTPVVFFLSWDILPEIIALYTGKSEIKDPAVLYNMIKNIGLTTGISLVISSLLQSLILPVYNAVMYFGLQARKSGAAINQPDLNSKALRGI